MRDEEYLFKEDVREKAITARSAKKRPRHSGCRLPQYTAKEMKLLKANVRLRSMLSSEIKWLGADGEGCP